MDDDDDAVGMEYVVSGQSDAPVKSEQASNVEQEEQAKEDEPANEEVSEYLGMVSLSLCSLGNYTFGTSLRNKKKPWRSFANRMLDRKARYDVEGAPRATVEVVMMAHHNGIPHVLLLKSANPTITGFFCWDFCLAVMIEPVERNCVLSAPHANAYRRRQCNESEPLSQQAGSG